MHWSGYVRGVRAAVSGLTMVSLQFYKTFSGVFRRKTGSRCWKPVNSSHFYNLLEVASKADSRNKYLSMYLFVCMKIKDTNTISYFNVRNLIDMVKDRLETENG